MASKKEKKKLKKQAARQRKNRKATLIISAIAAFIVFVFFVVAYFQHEEFIASKIGQMFNLYDNKTVISAMRERCWDEKGVMEGYMLSGDKATSKSNIQNLTDKTIEVVKERLRLFPAREYMVYPTKPGAFSVVAFGFDKADRLFVKELCRRKSLFEVRKFIKDGELTEKEASELRTYSPVIRSWFYDKEKSSNIYYHCERDTILDGSHVKSYSFDKNENGTWTLTVQCNEKGIATIKELRQQKVKSSAIYIAAGVARGVEYFSKLPIDGKFTMVGNFNETKMKNLLRVMPAGTALPCEVHYYREDIYERYEKVRR